MKRRLRHLYWTGIVITMVMATVAVAMMVKLKIDDSREALRSILHAASAWTMESTEDLQSMAESIASVSPPLRVTFLMEQGLVLADSEADALAMENHASRPEVQAALQGGIGESLRFSDTQAMLTLYAAMRISPALILRLSYPLWEIAGMLAMYGVGLLCLFLVLYILQRRTLGRFGKDLMLQMDEVRRLLDTCFTTAADGIPGNDDTGTMSAWAVFSMMGFYPDCPGEPYYTLTSPTFDRVEIDTERGTLVIEKRGEGYIDRMTLGDKPLKNYRILHDELLKGGKLTFELQTGN